MRIIHYTQINQSALIDNESSCQSVASSITLLVFVKMEWILLELKMQLNEYTIMAQLDTKTNVVQQ